MKKKGNILIVLNIILLISLIITLFLGAKHYKQISNNSEIEEHQINTMANTIKNEVNTKKTSEVKDEGKINTEEQYKKNQIEVENISISPQREITYKSSNNNSGYAVKSPKKAQSPTETPRKEETSTKAEKEEQIKPIEVINHDSTISKEDNSKTGNTEIKEQLPNSSGNQSKKAIEQPAVSEDENPIINNSTTSNLHMNSEIDGNSNNDSNNKSQK